MTPPLRAAVPDRLRGEPTMHRCLVFVVALCLAAVLGAPSVVPAQPAMVWKAGTATSGGNPLNDTMEIFAKQMAERSRGRIKVDVHIANALAKGEAAHLEGVQLGTIDVVAIGSAPVGGMFEPSYQALDLPFLWATREQVWKAMEANPVPMPYVEVYLAMKQGTIDGMELPSFTLTSDKFHEVTKYYSLTRHSYPPIAWFMNLKKYQALAPDLQKAVEESMGEACQAHRRIEVQKEKSDFEIMKKAGVQINEVKDIKAFQGLMKPAYDYVEGQVGKEFMAKLRAAVQAAATK